MAPNSSLIEEFCGEKFKVFDVEKVCFSECFTSFVFLIVPFFLLALFSSYYIGRMKIPDIAINPSRQFIVRLIAGALTLLLTALKFIVSFSITKKLLPIYVLSSFVQALSLLVHVIYLKKVCNIHFLYKHGPFYAIGSWILTFIFFILNTEYYVANLIYAIKNHILTSSLLSDTICSVLICICQLVYFGSVIVPNEKYRTVSLSYATDSRDDELIQDTEEERLLVSDTYSEVSQDKDEEDCPVDNANLFSKLIFYWVRPLMQKGSHRTLHTTKDVYALPNDLSTNKLNVIFHEKLSDLKLLNINNTHEQNDSKKNVLLHALSKAYGCVYFSLGILKLLADVLGFAGPLLLYRLISFIEQPKSDISMGYWYAFGLFLTTLVGSFLSTHFDYQVNKIKIKFRTSLITSVYGKTINAESTRFYTYTIGEVTNLMSTDIDRVVNFCASFHQFWSLPFQVAIALYLLYQQVGIVFLAGVGLALVMIVFNRYLAIKIGQYNKKMMSEKDNRVKTMQELLLGIRVIKFNAWEAAIFQRINLIRNLELKSLKGIKYFDALCVYLWATTPVLISLLTFSVYSALGNELTAAKVFTVIALINMLIAPLNAFPWVINGLMEAWISIKRLNLFVSLPDAKLDDYYSPLIDNKLENPDQDAKLDLQHGDFTWNAENNTDIKLHLSDININIKEGQFIGVVGVVGSGKSSLLSAICAEMRKMKGSVLMNKDDVAFVSQEPWLQNMTIKENILWDKEYDNSLYDSVVESCALHADFNALIHADDTEVGENGVTLSGGQKARISLARAIYQDKSLYLLDDPLAAVDQHVASHLYECCIQGMLAKKTRILCTHHTKYLRHADQVIVMEDGKIHKIGSPEDILPQFTDPQQKISLTKVKNKKETRKIDEERDVAPTNKVGLMTTEEKESGTVALHVYSAYWKAIGSLLSSMIILFLVLMQASKVISDWWLSYWIANVGNGTISSPTSKDFVLNQTVWMTDVQYTTLLHQVITYNGTIYNAALFLIVTSIIADETLTLKQGQNIFTSFYSMCWQGLTKPVKTHSGLHGSVTLGFFTWYLHDYEASHNYYENKHSDVKWYLMVYGCIAAANSFATLFRAFTFAYGGVRAAQLLHKTLLQTVMKAPISFFNSTPIGRIVNRFSSDMYAIDDSLPFILNIFLAQLVGVIGTIVITCYGFPWFLLALLPLAAFYYYIQHYYRWTSREVKRLNTISLSPIYANFNETILGLSTIHAFQKNELYMKKNIELVEVNQRCVFSSLAAQEWFNIRLQMIGVAMVTAVAFLTIIMHEHGQVSPGIAGLSLSYALSVTGRLSGVITSFTETEKQMVAVERQSYYIKNIPNENKDEDSDYNISSAWPSQGEVLFQNISLRYRKDLPLALNNVSFIAESGAKVGIVGRTGSGKSSLLMVLFNMVKPCNGSLLIDGINIKDVPLYLLRSGLSVIPQDPFLFSGSIRDNLAPIGYYNDTELWDALKHCGLHAKAISMGGLDADVGERGRNFSVGQRQLLCLGRAMLTKSKIICLDEATGNIDMESDLAIQYSIRECFKDCTLLTIAHRIETVMDSDKVIVMDSGRVVEIGAPADLIVDTSSYFYSLACSGTNSILQKYNNVLPS